MFSVSREALCQNVPQVQRRLVALDPELIFGCAHKQTQGVFVLPTSKECIRMNDPHLHVAMSEALEQASDEFEPFFQEVGSGHKKRTLQELHDRTASEQGPPTPRIRVETPTPSDDELQTLHSFSMDLTVPATRLGDAMSVLAERNGPCQVTAFFSAMAAHVGPDESVTRGFESAVALYHEREELHRSTNHIVQSLNDEIQSLKSHASTQSLSTLSTNSEASTLSNALSTDAPLTAKGFMALMKGIGRAEDMSMLVTMPLSKICVSRLVKLLLRWRGLDEAAAEKAKAECKRVGQETMGGTFLTSLSAVVATLLRRAGGATTTQVLLFCSSISTDDPTAFTFQGHLLNQNPDTNEQVSSAQVLNMDLVTIPVLLHHKSELIIYLPEG